MSKIKQESTSSRCSPQKKICARTGTTDIFTVKSETNRVMKKPQQPSVASFRCEYCTLQFSLKVQLVRHVVTIHQQFNVKREPETSQSSTTGPAAVSSRASVNDNSHLSKPGQIRFQCEICQRVCTSRE
eukprot:239149_1